MNPVLAIAAAGGALLAIKGVPASPVPQSPSGATRTVSPAAAMKAKLAATSSPGIKQPVTTARASSYLNYAPSGANPSELEAEVLRRAKAEFASLTAEAKRKACEDLKRANPGAASIQAMDCGNVTFDGSMRAIAAAGGAAACAATGAGAVVSPLCGIAAAWLAAWAGPKVKAWIADFYNGEANIAGYAGCVARGDKSTASIKKCAEVNNVTLK